MYILLEACQHPGILRVLYFVTLLLDIVFVLVPIGLIVMLLIDFSKVVISGDEKASKSTKLVGKRILYAVIIFCIPWIVNLFMDFLDSAGLHNSYRTCLENAKSGNFDYYDELLEIEENNNNNNNNIGNTGNSNNTGSSSMLRLAANSLVNTVRGELGRDNSNSRYGGGTSNWCGYFASWALKNTTMSNGTTLYSYLSKNGSINIAAASGLWPAFQGNRLEYTAFHKGKAYGGSYSPKPGDVVWYQWDGGYCRSNYGRWNGSTMCSDQVEIVTVVTGNSITSVGGNSGTPGLVRERTISLSSEVIIAFGTFY